MPHIVVLGGGFAGTYAVRELERHFRHDQATTITLISRYNYMVFTPLLAEVAGNSIEARHAVPPLRIFLTKARFHQGEVRDINLQLCQVTLEHADGRQIPSTYDYLVLALGAVTNYHRVPGAADYSFDLKSLDDAIRLRNHVLATLELADVTTDPLERQALLTFLAAGSGYAGVEGLGQLVDFVHKALPFYPTIKPQDLRFILATRSERLLAQIDDQLGRYVIRKLRERGVEIRLGVTVTEVTTQNATLEPGGPIPTATVLWAAGIAVNPLLSRLELPKHQRGAILVEPTLQVVGHPHIFALGDCAAVPSADGFSAPTAQNATRQGQVAAANIAAVLHGRRPRPFQYTPAGSLASLGNYQAVAQVWGLPFSGLPAWLAWRSVYLFKLPDLSRKLRVALDWLLEALLPTDIVQLPVLPSDHAAVAASVPTNDVKVATPAPLPGQTEEPPAKTAPLHTPSRRDNTYG